VEPRIDNDLVHGLQRHPHATANYRTDIDGLRALAVGAVVLYHVDARGFSGGFVGVDVFFVISGYLITNIILRDLALGAFSIAEFYRRRILRLFPALFFTLSMVTVFACMTMLPQELAQYARSLGATVLFISNFEFFREADYFELGNAARPLLHTWSLAIEEQWYLFWPLVLAAIGLSRRRVMLAVAAVVTAASLLLGAFLISVDAAATFYLLPTRAWELGIGALAAISGVRLQSRILNEALAVSGLVLILGSINLYTYQTLFPGLAAVPPCLGAGLIIVTGQTDTWVGKLLSLKMLQFIGWISYSLYLWHWPLIVFTENGLFLPMVPAVATGVVVASLILATVTWCLVERPSRMGNTLANSAVIKRGLAASAVGLAIAAAIPLSTRFIVNLTPDQVKIADYLFFKEDAYFRRGVCFKVGPRSSFNPEECFRRKGAAPVVTLVGDSHAAHLWSGLSAYSDLIDVQQATFTGCVATLSRQSDGESCESLMDRALRGELPLQNKAVALIIASRWRQADIPELERTLKNPVVRAAHPILIGPIPEYSMPLPRLLVYAEMNGDRDLVDRSRVSLVFDLDKEMRLMAARTGTPYFSLVDLLCRRGRCRTFAAGNVPMQFDYGHLTPEGSKVVADAMLPFIMKQIRNGVDNQKIARDYRAIKTSRHWVELSCNNQSPSGELRWVGLGGVEISDEKAILFPELGTADFETPNAVTSKDMFDRPSRI
jgi:peptidoglycan/LPS O-acetylase OafA/YrhL